MKVMPDPTYDALFEVLLKEGKLILLMIEIYQTRPLEPSRLFLEFNMRVLGWMLHIFDLVLLDGSRLWMRFDQRRRHGCGALHLGMCLVW